MSVEPERSGTKAATGGRDVLWPGVMIGVGLVGTLDEVVLHQLLHWHHFYDRSTSSVGLVSDGIFHVVSTVLLLLGAYLLLNGRPRLGRSGARRACSGVLLGGGAFNFYDGTVQHKLLKLHQVRPGVPNETPYDVVFIGLSLALLALGWSMLRKSPRLSPNDRPREA